MEDGPFNAVKEGVDVDALPADRHVVAYSVTELLSFFGSQEREVVLLMVDLSHKGLRAGGIGYCRQSGDGRLLERGVGDLELIDGHLDETVDADVALHIGAREEVEGVTLLGDRPYGVGRLDVAKSFRAAKGRDGNGSAMLLGSSQQLGILFGVDIAAALGDFNVAEGDVYVAQAFVVEIGFELMALMLVVKELDGLLEADSDEQTNADGGDVDEEVAPGVGGFVGRVHGEQGGLLGMRCR